MSATTISHFAPSATLRFGVPRILAVWLRRARDRARDRVMLAGMSDRDLLDIRATRYEMTRELSKPFWRG